MGVFHLLHLAFLPGLESSLGQRCFVNPRCKARLLRPLEVPPYWARLLVLFLADR